MSIRLDLTTAHLFMAVAEEGSIARASRRACIVPSALSKRLSELEQRLGVLLLRRHRGGVELTVAGMAVLRASRNIIREEEALEQEIRSIGEGAQGHVRVSASETILSGYLPGLLGEFLRKNPGIKVDLQERLVAGVIRSVEDGEADVGIFAGEAPPTHLWSQVCHSDRLVVVMPEGHPLTSIPEVTLSAILDYDIIGQEPNGMLGTLIRRQAAALGRPLNSRVRADGFDVVCRLVEAELGIGIMSDAAAALLTPSLSLVTRPIGENWACREHRVCAASSDGDTPAKRLLLGALTSMAISR